MSKRLLNFIWDRGMWFRQRKVCRALADQGWVIDAVVHDTLGKPWEWGRTFEYPAHVPQYTLADKVKGKINQILGRPPALYDSWQTPYLSDILASYSYDAVQWTFLDEASEAADIAHSYGCAFILDQLDNFPYNKWSAERDFKTFDSRNNLNRWFQYESEAIHKADAVLVTIEEMKQRFVGMHYAEPDNIFAVQNTEHIDTWTSVPHSTELDQRFKDKIVGLYVGGCSRHRGVDVVIKALARIRDEAPDMHLVIVGDGYGAAEWKDLAKELGVGDVVHFEGWKQFPDAQQYYHIADFGVIPHHKYGQTDNTVPHKLYQNFIMGLPILASSCHPLLRIINETQGGLVFEAGDPASAAEVMRSFCDSTLREKLGRNARLAMDGACGWDHLCTTLETGFAKAIHNFNSNSQKDQTGV